MTLGKVSIVKYKRPYDSVSKAIALSGAMDKLKKGDRVFLKPNIVFWSRHVPMPPWGVISTTRVVEDVVRELKKRGAGQIIIGEGTITNDPMDRKTSADAFEVLGYNKMAELYGIKVVNCFERDFQKVDIGGGIKLNFSKDLLDADFVVSVPVLKTHAQTMVSISQKNIKGCLDIESRKLCHSDNFKKDLDFYIAGFTKILPRACAVVDGIYTLERGPGFTGKARRSNILIASKDLLSADIAGAALLGIDPAEVPHLKKAAEYRNTAPVLKNIEISGTSIENMAENMAKPHKWYFPYNQKGDLPANLARAGIKGLSFPMYDHSLCTYCSGLVGLVQMAVGKAWHGVPFDKVEILTGKIKRPTSGMNHTILLGKCQVKLNKNNSDIKDALPVPGCPPRIDRLISSLKKAGIDVDESFFDNIDTIYGRFMDKYKEKPEFSQQFYRLNN